MIAPVMAEDICMYHAITSHFSFARLILLALAKAIVTKYFLDINISEHHCCHQRRQSRSNNESTFPLSFILFTSITFTPR